MSHYAFRCGLLSLTMLSACAVGNKYRFDNVIAEIKAGGKIAVAVAAQDGRKQITAGEEEPSYVGVQRAGFGNPFDVTTESERPLAEAMSAAICASLTKKGINATPIAVPVSASSDVVRAKLLASKPDVGLLLRVAAWRSDTYHTVTLTYDLQLRVLDSAGKQVAESRVKGERNLGGSAWNPTKHARKAVPQAFKKILEELLNHDAVRTALSSSPPTPTA